MYDRKALSRESCAKIWSHASEAFREACAFLREHASLRKLLAACAVKRTCSLLTTSVPACCVSGSGRFPSTSVWFLKYTSSEGWSSCTRYHDDAISL